MSSPVYFDCNISIAKNLDLLAFANRTLAHQVSNRDGPAGWEEDCDGLYVDYLILNAEWVCKTTKFR